MAIEVIVPRLGWSMEEGAFVAWLKKDGEFVQAGEPLFSIEGDKAIQEIESIDSGILKIAPNCPKPGAPVRVGDVLGHLLAESESAPSAPMVITAERKSDPVKPTATPNERPEPTVTDPTRLPRISPRAVRAAAELGVDWLQLRGSGRTGRIRERDIHAAVFARGAKSAERLISASLGSHSGSAVLVTGGCGFIGTWVLRELLKRGMRAVVLDTGGRPARWHRVIGNDAEGISLVQGSLLDRSLLARLFEEAQISHIIHLAAMLTPACNDDPFEACQINVLGSVALFEQARKAAARVQGFSYASSVAVFGEQDQPVTLYGVFKRTVEMIASQYWRQFKLPSVGIRPQVAYGPERDVGMSAGPSLAARAAAEGRSFTISYTGRVGYDYVEDIASAFVRAAVEVPDGARVVDLPGEIADINQVIAAIYSAAPESSGKLFASGPAIPNHAPREARWISELFPDWTTTSLSDGMRRTVAFYQRQQGTERLNCKIR